tara:strand:- start:278 stop:628 length:351 start_codon:yes stop_codon:yes gene_type:complete
MNISVYLFFVFIISVEPLLFRKILYIKNNRNVIKVKNNYNHNNYDYINKDKVFLHKIINNECGHCKIDKKFLSFAKAFTNLKEGNCKDNGYTIFTGYDKIIVPVLGKINIEKFIKI